LPRSSGSALVSESGLPNYSVQFYKRYQMTKLEIT
jgi:hypothetical protein